MTLMEWMLLSSLTLIYLVCLFTVCGITFRKGHVALGIFGIFLPFLWLIGATLPARNGSAYALDEQARLSS